MSEGVGAVLRGMLLGFSIAAPVGPIGVLCIRRTLAQREISATFSGLWSPGPVIRDPR